MTGLAILLAGTAAGALSAIATRRAERALEALKADLQRGQRQWGPETATQDEERLARRLGHRAPQDIAADVGRYADWQRTLRLQAGARFFKQLCLGAQRTVEEPALVVREFTIGERLMILAGVRDHLVQTLGRQLGQEAPDKAAQRDDLVGAGAVAGVEVFDHVPSSGLQPGCGPETAAEASPSSPSTGAAA